MTCCRRKHEHQEGPPKPAVLGGWKCFVKVLDKTHTHTNTHTGKHTSELLPCDIGGASKYSPGMMYFQILNEELFRTPESSISQGS